MARAKKKESTASSGDAYMSNSNCDVEAGLKRVNKVNAELHERGYHDVKFGFGAIEKLPPGVVLHAVADVLEAFVSSSEEDGKPLTPADLGFSYGTIGDPA